MVQTLMVEGICRELQGHVPPNGGCPELWDALALLDPDIASVRPPMTAECFAKATNMPIEQSEVDTVHEHCQERHRDERRAAIVEGTRASISQARPDGISPLVAASLRHRLRCHAERRELHMFSSRQPTLDSELAAQMLQWRCNGNYHKVYKGKYPTVGIGEKMWKRMLKNNCLG